MNNTITSSVLQTQLWLLSLQRTSLDTHRQIHCQTILQEDIVQYKLSPELFWRPWWISSNSFETMQQETNPPSLQLLFKASMKTGEIPIDLKQAIITPIYKGGSRNLPKNYHPVALTSRLIKILEGISKNIHQFLEKHRKMNPKQHGFCSGRFCLSQLLEHHNKILEELESRTMLMLST